MITILSGKQWPLIYHVSYFLPLVDTSIIYFSANETNHFVASW